MGIVYCGPFADAINEGERYEHEGYAARILPDGTETGTWTYETREFRGYRAHCDCGWRGTAVYPATDMGERAADEEWDRDHLRPLIDAVARRHTVPATVLLAFARDLRKELQTTVNNQGHEVLTEHSRGVADAANRLEGLLDNVAAGNGDS